MMETVIKRISIYDVVFHVTDDMSYVEYLLLLSYPTDWVFILNHIHVFATSPVPISCHDLTIFIYTGVSIILDKCPNHTMFDVRFMKCPMYFSSSYDIQ